MQSISRHRLIIPIATIFAASVLSVACGPPAPATDRTIVSTGNVTPPSTEENASAGSDTGTRTPLQENAAVPTDLRAQLIKDGRTAAEILRTAACEETDAGVWAAVYALRVGLKPDSACIETDLLRGIHAESLLLRTLSWRHLVTEKNIPLPEAPNLSQADPTVRILAALAYRIRSLPPPADLAGALAVPSDPPPKTAQTALSDRLDRLLALARPFDDGLAALAATLAEARFAKAVETTDGVPIWTATRVRNDLLRTLGITAATEPEDETPSRPAPTAVGDRLENRLADHPEPQLCAMAASAEPALRIEALRALVIRTGNSPSICALGAAAAAFRRPESELKIEGARTFLALIRLAGS